LRDRARHQFLGIEPDPHGVAPLAVDGGLAHARQALQARLHDALADVGELQQGQTRRLERHEDERLCVGLLLGDDGLLDVLRQPAAHARDPVAHVLRRVVHVALEVELDGDVAELLGAGAGEGADARHRAELLLQDVRDGRFDHLGIGTGQQRLHRDDRRIDVRELADRELAVADDAEQDERGAHHGGQHRPLDGKIGELHRHP
jgi:hypothetical protein